MASTNDLIELLPVKTSPHYRLEVGPSKEQGQKEMDLAADKSDTSFVYVVFESHHNIYRGSPRHQATSA